MNVRSDKQKLMPLSASQEFIDHLHAGLEATFYSNRSQFIRDAIVEKLQRMGVKVRADLASPPPRGLALLTRASRAKGVKKAAKAKANSAKLGGAEAKAGTKKAGRSVSRGRRK